MKEARTAFLSARIRAEVKEALKKCAAAEHRSAQSLIEMVLADYCRMKGFLPSTRKPFKREKGDGPLPSTDRPDSQDP